MQSFVAVFVGSAIGGVMRYSFGLLASRYWGASFPWGTLGVNLAGSWLIGFIMVVTLERTTVSPELRLFLTTGLLGGLTTFSAFAYETVRLIEDGQWQRTFVNIAANVLFGIAAAYVGVISARGLK